MLKNVSVLFITDLMEIIHIKLSHKGRKISVTEINGKYLLLKSFNIIDNKVSSFLIPTDNLDIDVVLNHKINTYKIS
jgi:hypothetical protein